MFERFSRAYPGDLHGNSPVDAEALASFSREALGVQTPAELLLFWRNVGSGYFGDRILYFFGDGAQAMPRDSYQQWNTKNFWRDVYPPPDQGGPVFFAETCFGDQLGFRWEQSSLVFVLFSVDTFEAFRVAENGNELFDVVLASQDSLIDDGRYRATRERLGFLRDGMHYAPLLSPLVGGSGAADNMCLETANVHFRTAIATYQAIHLP